MAAGHTLKFQNCFGRLEDQDDMGMLPIINTGIAHKNAGVGQIGAGVTRAPLACFSKAVTWLSECHD